MSSALRRRWARRGPGAEHDLPQVPVNIRGWHATFWVIAGLGGLLVATRSRLTGAERLEAAAALAVLGLAYAVLVQRRERQTGWRAHAYLVIAVLVTGVAAAIEPNLSMLLFIVYPQIWMFTVGIAVGAAYTTAVSAATLLGFLTAAGFSWTTVRDSGPQLLVALLFSLLLGVWISRIVDQSVERADLIDQLQTARTDLSEAEHARGVMAERERIAREIHDTLAQGFTSIIMLSQAAAAGMAKDPRRATEQLGLIEDVARENLAEARSLVAAFGPVGLAESTLPDAVRRLAERFAAQAGIGVDVEVADAAAGLGPDEAVVLLRAVQESLTNVRRHAGARHVVVRLVVGDDGARVEVDDDGVGFDTRGAGAAAGYGLAGMRDRVEEIGGEVDVTSAPGRGTRVTVLVPTRPVAGLQHAEAEQA